MSFTFRSFNITTSGASPRTVTKPTGTAEGDLLVLQSSSSGADVTPTPPTDFVEVIAARNTTVPTVRVYWKMAGASEPADYSVTYPSGSGHTVAMAAFTPGAGNLAEVDAATTRANGAGNRIFDEVTTTQTDDLLLCLAALGNIGSTSDALMTERWDNGSSPRIFMMSQTVAAAGATGSRTATGTASANQASTVAFKEVSSLDLDPPDFFTATAISSTDIYLSWANDSLDVDGWELERSAAGAETWSQIADLPADQTAYLDSGLTPATAYDYRIRAYAE